MKKGLIILLLSVILFLNLVSSAVIEQAQAPPEKKSFMGRMGDTITSPLFLGVLFFLVLIAIFIILGFFLFKWIINYFKLRNNIFYKIKSERKRLAKIHSSYPIRSYFKIKKNTPIRLVRMINDKPQLSEPIAYHKGDLSTNEGNLVIAMNLIGKKKLFLFPETDLLIIPNRSTINVVMKVKTNSNQQEKVAINNIPTADEIVQFNKSEILIYAESITHLSDYFYIPVLKTKDGKIVDLSMPIYATIREVVVENYMFDIADDMVKLTRRAVDLNPSIRAINKLNDTNNNIDMGNKQ